MKRKITPADPLRLPEPDELSPEFMRQAVDRSKIIARMAEARLAPRKVTPYMPDARETAFWHEMAERFVLGFERLVAAVEAKVNKSNKSRRRKPATRRHR